MYPVIVQFGDVVIDPWSIIGIVAFIVMISFVKRECGRMGLSPLLTLEAAAWASLGGLLGGRLVYLIVHFDLFWAKPSMALEFWNGGLFSYGGISGAILAVTVFAIRKNVVLGRALDLASLTPPLSMGMGRIGCFCVGCDYGKPTSMPWAITVTDLRSLTPPELHGVPIHPTQLYMAGMNFVVFAVGYALYRKKQPPGRVFGAVALLYSIGRFSIEFFRADEDRGFVGCFSSGQLFCLVWATIGIVAIATAGKGKWNRGAI